MYIKFFLLVEIGFVFEFCWIITLLWRKFFISGYTCISFIFFFILNKWIYYSKTRFVELRDCYVPLAKWMSKVKLGLTFILKYEVRSFIQIIQNILLVPILSTIRYLYYFQCKSIYLNIQKQLFSAITEINKPFSVDVDSK